MTEENIKLNNIIFNMQNKNKKMYSSSLIKKLEELLKEKSIDKIVYFLLDNNINLGNICPINYRNLLILNKFNKKECIEKLEEYKNLKLFIENKLNEKDLNFIDFLKNIYQNNSRKKGSLFKNVFLKEYNGNLKIITYINDLNFISDEDFIFIPAIDSDINELLRRLNIELKHNKGRDIFIKYKGKYFIGEAKEINEVGGSQKNQFNDMLNCISETNEILIGIGIIYGLCLSYSNCYLDEINNNRNILTFSEVLYNLEKNLLKYIN